MDQDSLTRLKQYELTGRRFALSPLIPQHHRALYELSVSEENSFRWRYRGAIPTFDTFEKSLYTGALCQFVITPIDDLSKICGLVVAYNVNLQDGYCYMAVMTDRRLQSGALEGVALFLRYVLQHWPFRKVYLETPEFNVVQFASAIRLGLFKEEGRLRKHQYLLDDYWDILILAAYRDDLRAFADRFDTLFVEAATP